MQTLIKIVIIIALAVAVSLGLYVLVQSQFSMNFGGGGMGGGMSGGMSPGFSWLLKLRAAENGGQIAPSLDELQSSGALSGMSGGGFGGSGGGGFGGGGQGSQAAALSKGFDLTEAGPALLKYLGLLGAAALIAALLELLLVALRNRSRTAHAAG